MKSISVFFVVILFCITNQLFAQSFTKENKVEDIVINITATNNPKDIVDVKFAYAFGDSTYYPDLKFEMIKTPFVQKYSAKSFEGLIQSVNKNIEIKVNVSISSNGILGTNSSAIGRIIRVYRDPKSCGVATF